LHTFESKISFNITNIAIHPDPFNSSVTIQYFINDEDKVQLTIYNVIGKKIKTLSNKFENTALIFIRRDSKD
tara:strand:- start:474 stop:689 length:216 start_codon:yes stop_codon:yes gene_type:complete